MTDLPHNFDTLLDYIFYFNCRNMECTKCPFVADDLICDILCENSYDR